MPNYVTNVIKYDGDPEQIRKMLEFIKDDKHAKIQELLLPKTFFGKRLSRALRKIHGRGNMLGGIR